MILLLVTIHVLVCLFLIFVVLLQSAQAADLAGAFGGGGSQTALGMRGATTLLQKATTGAAVVFMLTSLVLGMADRTQSSIIQGLDGPAATEPAPPPTDDQAEAEDETAGAEGAEEQTGDPAAGERSDQQGGQEQAAGEQASEEQGSGADQDSVR